MNYTTHKYCEECSKRVPVERIVIKNTEDGNCFYCRTCYDYILYLDMKEQELLNIYKIDQLTIQKEVDEMNNL